MQLIRCVEPKSFRIRGLFVGISIICVGCGQPSDPPQPPTRPVRTLTIQAAQTAAGVKTAGHVEAKDQVPLSFRIGGRLAERLVGVGDRVQEGQVVARLEPDNELNELRSARATLSISESRLRQAENYYRRQSRLRELGHAPQSELELAEQGRTAARAQVDSAKANVRIAEEVVAFTTLAADAPGIVTAVGAETGEIVAAGRMILNLARRDGRDAVLDVSEEVIRSTSLDAPVLVSLSASPTTTVSGRVREMAPQADLETRTFRVRIGLTNPPPSFRLGAAVIAVLGGSTGEVLSVPSAAVIKHGADAGVWIVDPKAQTVSLRKLDVLRANAANTYIASGLSIGDIVVAAGANSLREGQQVRLTGTESR
ncbi:MAG: efflux RND transporter periplasmic adaptor subunit [Hyphomicrobiaceae bacterium]